MHVPVLLNEVITALNVRSDGSYVDCTVGVGGHAAAILEHSAPNGRLLGLDRDPDAVAAASKRLAAFGKRATLVNTSYLTLETASQHAGFGSVDGILFDLGLSSAQLESSGRGFSFQRDEPLDMRFGREGRTAADLLNDLSERELANLIYRYGEEPASRAIARAIVSHRPIRTSGQLASLIQNTVGGRGRIHPATRTFQALRIAVNDELAALEAALPQAVGLLKPGGRLVVISFHSLEDRLVKQFLQRESTDCLCPPRLPVCQCGHRATVRRVADKVIVPGPEELQTNPRARSAKLRVAEKLGPAHAATASAQ
jgi:16S rRNA (cytosine1402-N4)-methyltransferase